MPSISLIRKDIIFWSRELYQRCLLTGRLGNVSCKITKNKILITAHDTYLGFLSPKDLVFVDFKGKPLQNKTPSFETKMHLEIYKNLSRSVIIHAHPFFVNSFFFNHNRLKHFSLETEYYFKDLAVIQQDSIFVKDTQSVVRALKKSNIAVLRNHGIIAAGCNFKEIFSLIDMLEQLCKVNILSSR